MSQTPRIFDRPTLLRHRNRARTDDLFLHQLAAEEIQDRLSMVNRTFTSTALVTGFADVWGNAFPNALLTGDTDVLALEQGMHDLVIHAMCLHWSNDPIGQIIQCRRALRPDGLFLAVCLGGETLQELRLSLAEAESRATGGLSPRVAPMADVREWGALLQRAGLTLPVADTVQNIAEYRDLTHLMHDLRGMGETNALSDRLRHLTRREVFLNAAQIYRDRFSTEGGKLRASFELICLTGWAPDESQPRPLRPGSAQTRLAEALKTTESKLPD